MRARLFPVMFIMLVSSGCSLRYGHLTFRSFQPKREQLPEKAVKKSYIPIHNDAGTVFRNLNTREISESLFVEWSKKNTSALPATIYAAPKNKEIDYLKTRAKTELADSAVMTLPENKNAIKSFKFSLIGLGMGALFALGILFYATSSGVAATAATATVSTTFFLLFYAGVNIVIVISLLAISWGVKALMEIKEAEKNSTELFPNKKRAYWGIALGFLLLCAVVMLGVLL